MRPPRALLILASLFGSCAAITGCIRRDISEADPNTTNVFIDRIENQTIDKIDLLFVVDNSVSMADKQKILEQAVPRMLERLVRPDCVSPEAEAGSVVRAPSVAATSAGDLPTCPENMVLEFNPVNDIHIGVISSSLGGHGSTACSEAEKNDRALLMPRVREGIPDPHGTGFLVWHPAADDDEAGTPVEDDLEGLKEDFRKHVVAAGEKGCGFEAPLEAWYRFLVDPSPPLALELNSNQSQSTGVDQEVLNQRASFLRPDSLVGVVLLTDENDCSMMEGGDFYPNAKLGWMAGEQSNRLPGGSAQLPVATAACETNPNSPCCLSCFVDKVPSSCDDKNALASCTSVGQPRVEPHLDRVNVRCFEQQRRFGVDLLYPIQRYVSGLTDAQITDSQTGVLSPNPLLLGADGSTPRSTGLVFLAGIAGIPWQDLATDETRGDPGALTFLGADQLLQKTIELPDGSAKVNRWDLILGKKGQQALSSACNEADLSACGAAPVPPLDPFLIESIESRSGTNPLTGDSITNAPTWNLVNGHEQNNLSLINLDGGTDGFEARDDLQYSCTFPLEPYGGAKLCDETASGGCDCQNAPERERSLCRSDETTPGTQTQHWGKAYPPTRILEVLKAFGNNSIPASICPKVHDPESPDYGYNPAVNAIIDRLSGELEGRCLPRKLSLDEEGLVDCMVVEARKEIDGALDCGSGGRRVLSPKREAAVLEQLESTGWCQGDDCASSSLCEIKQFTNAEADAANRETCLTSPVGSEHELEPGYCYLEAESGIGDPALVANCPASQRQLLRFVGPETPAKKSTAFVACSGDISGARDVVPAAPGSEE